MKKLLLCVALVVFMFGTGVCFAESAIPNLVGTWKVQSEAGVLLKSAETGAWTHHSKEFSTLTAELVITKQQGRIFYGTLTSKMATEEQVGVIGWDNKTFYFVDQDGFTDGVIVNNDKINCIYRHVGAKDSVVAAGTMTRVK